ncbi:hypothetical protein, partial [Mucilaginibacter sp. 10I4]|uniref:hypothetical protein n=1 Tax=Mucilaginibacter sp. 10I4 TaxID=3048580 RepID=UPI002B22E090
LLQFLMWQYFGNKTIHTQSFTHTGSLCDSRSGTISAIAIKANQTIIIVDIQSSQTAWAPKF